MKENKDFKLRKFNLEKINIEKIYNLQCLSLHLNRIIDLEDNFPEEISQLEIKKTSKEIIDLLESLSEKELAFFSKNSLTRIDNSIIIVKCSEKRKIKLFQQKIFNHVYGNN
jgi:hypothetical protein